MTSFFIELLPTSGKLFTAIRRMADYNLSPLGSPRSRPQAGWVMVRERRPRRPIRSAVTARSRDAPPGAHSGRRGTPGPVDRALDACRVHSWRDEHRQHCACGGKDRFWTVRLMDSYDPAIAFSAIDEFGRYAYANQPTIAQSNLARFAETLLPLVDPNPKRASNFQRGDRRVRVALSGALACRHAGEARTLRQ